MTIQIEYETEIALGVKYRELIERVVNATRAVLTRRRSAFC